MRGKPMLSKQDLDAARITPADAGKTSTASRNAIGTWDHPRGCGENNRADKVRLDDIGSPPRMRGKPRVSVTRGAKPGITPADAGKTIFLYSFLSKNRDHPRGCGENKHRETRRIPLLGSPPRMRGKPRFALQTARGQRITPADAGKTARAADRQMP